MTNTIKVKQSAVAGKVPTTAQLQLGELAVNTRDGKLFLKKNVSGSESIVEIGGGTGTVTSVAVSGGTTGLTTSGGPITGSGTITLGGTLAVANGGTGATDAGTARTNLGLGTISTQAASNVAITGGSISGITDLAVADGGTGASTAANARTNLGLAIGTNVQAWDGDLDAIAALAGTTGLLRKTAANTWSLDTSSYLTGNQTVTLSGDVSGSGSTSITATLANSGVSAGTYRSVTVDVKGRVTAGTTPTTLSGYGITDALSNSTTSTQSGYFGDIFLYDDSTPSHYLGITNSANLTAARTLSLNVNNADRTVSLSGNLTVPSAATVSGTNTGDQTITLTGDVTGSGTGSFAATLASSGVSSGTYTNATITVDAKGRVTSASSGTGGGVSSFSAGTTGLTPSTGTAGAVTLAGTLALANGGTGATTAADARTNLGATTVGSNLFTLTNPSAVTFPRLNANNTVSALDAASFRTAIGAGTGSGTVTSVGLSLPAMFSVSGSPVTGSGTLTATLASQTANTVFVAPNGAAGTPTFRALVAADIPTLNQSTTGTAANVTGTVAVANGGTGATSASAARTSLAAAGSGAITGSGLTMTSARLLGRTTASTGAVEELSSVPVTLGGTGATTTGGARTGLGLGSTDNVTFAIVTGSTIVSSGGRFHGPNTNGSFFEAFSNEAAIKFGSSKTYSFSMQADRNVVLYDGSTVVWQTATTASDGRLKNVLGSVTDGLSVVSQLQPVWFSWKEDSVFADGGVVRPGFVAQDVADVLPRAVNLAGPPGSSESQRTYLLQKEEIVPHLVAAVKELKAIVDAQQQTISALEARLTSLESR